MGIKVVDVWWCELGVIIILLMMVSNNCNNKNGDLIFND